LFLQILYVLLEALVGLSFRLMAEVDDVRRVVFFQRLLLESGLAAKLALLRGIGGFRVFLEERCLWGISPAALPLHFGDVLLQLIALVLLTRSLHSYLNLPMRAKISAIRSLASSSAE
jgi:hypothetical protein